MTNGDDRNEPPGAMVDRKAEILAELAAPLRERARKHRSRQSLTAAALVALVACGLATRWTIAPRPPTSEGVASGEARSNETREPRRSSCVEIVAAPHVRVRLELVDDDELYDELRAAGFDFGVVRVGATVQIVTK